MKVEIKIYKTFDPELYALNAYGIKVTKLIKKALKHYVRGEYVHFHIPRSLTYDFDLKRRSYHLAIEITDEKSIDFLKTNIKPRQRTAFLKALVRGSLTTPQLGVFFKDIATNKIDTKLIQSIDLDSFDNVKILEITQKPKKDYTKILKDINIKEKKRIITTSKKKKTNNNTTPKESPTKEYITKEPEKQVEELSQEEKAKLLQMKYGLLNQEDVVNKKNEKYEEDFVLTDEDSDDDDLLSAMTNLME